MSEIKTLINAFVDQHGDSRNNLLPLFQKIVEKENYLSEESLVMIAEAMKLSTADVYGTATFYAYLSTVPRGKYIIRMCRNISCMMKAQAEVMAALSNHLKIKVGETTTDKKFTLLQVNCLGWCHKAPAMMINSEVFTDLTSQKAIQVINEFMQK
ncbi:MAG: NAD(P)H-dependent oxidoreductase subunit E [Bacteroidota bacterium]